MVERLYWPYWPFLIIAAFVVMVTAMAVRQPAIATSAHQLFDAQTGYRISRLRDPVPQNIAGGETLDVDKLEALIAGSQPLLIDVYDDRPSDLQRWSFGLLGKPASRNHITGSVTMAGFGEGVITKSEEEGLMLRLDQATRGDHAKPVVFYCLSNCWVSWNAAKRAIAFGYTNVKWFRDGIETWSDAGLPVEPVVH